MAITAGPKLWRQEPVGTGEKVVAPVRGFYQFVTEAVASDNTPAALEWYRRDGVPCAATALRASSLSGMAFDPTLPGWFYEQTVAGEPTMEFVGNPVSWAAVFIVWLDDLTEVVSSASIRRWSYLGEHSAQADVRACGNFAVPQS